MKRGTKIRLAIAIFLPLLPFLFYWIGGWVDSTRWEGVTTASAIITFLVLMIVVAVTD